MFTSIYHPTKDYDLQIKTGFDYCEWYSVGEPLRDVSESDDIDGVYFGCAHYPSSDAWVTIKDQKVLAVDTLDEKAEDLAEKYGVPVIST